MGPGFILVLVLYILVFAFCTYVCFVADPETSATARLVTEQLPNYVSNKAQKLLGKKCFRFLRVVLDQMLVIFYLVLVLGSWSIMFTYGYTWISDSKYVSSYHMYMGYFVFVLCMSSWRYASNVSPGIITKRTMARYDHYPYDNLLFVPDRICPTVGIRKLARSKYDRFTGQHVARFDHYCGWLDQPIGEENYRFFLWFLLVHTIMCSYGTFVTAHLFWGEVLEKDLLNATFFDVTTGREVKADWTIVAHFLFRRHFEMSAVLVLMAAMTMCLGAFLCFHIWITSRGMTTNETAKWKQIKKWHKQETKRYREAVKSGKVVNDTNVLPDDASKNDNPIMDPGPMPENIYNNGVIENWKEVLFPRSLRQDAIGRWKKSRHTEGVNSSDCLVPGKSKAT